MNIDRKILVVLGVILLSFVSFQLLASSPKDLKPAGWVNDFANVMPPDVRQALEQKLSDYEQQTSIEVFVVTVPSLDGLVVEDYTQKLADAWKPGKKGKDNGIIFLIAVAEHKTRIATGYGIEPDLTDVQTFRIQESVSRPLFREGKFSEGIVGVVDSMIQTLGKTPYQQRIEEHAKREQEEQKRAEEAGQMFLMILAGILIAAAIVTPCVLIANRYDRRKDAKKQATALLTSIAKSLESTKATLNKYQASAGVRKTLENAETKFELARSRSKSSKVNWVVLLAALLTIEELIDTATSHAKDAYRAALQAEETARQEKLRREEEARQAEWDRQHPEEAAARKEKERQEAEAAEKKRRKDEEARRKRRQEEEEEDSRRRRNSSSSSFGESSFGGSSSGGSSFGSGGGGSFGGGGSSSGW